MIVVGVLGILLAIAIPAYLNYIRASKQSTSIYNCSTAQHYLTTEVGKKASGSEYATSDAVADLNEGF